MCPYGVSGVVVREKERGGRAVDGIDVVVVVCRPSEIERLGSVGRRLPFRRYRRRGSSVVQILICDNSSPRSFTAMFRARTQLHRQLRCTQFPASQPFSSSPPSVIATSGSFFGLSNVLFLQQRQFHQIFLSIHFYSERSRDAALKMGENWQRPPC